jgi:hypothetical protein
MSILAPVSYSMILGLVGLSLRYRCGKGALNIGWSSVDLVPPMLAAPQVGQLNGWSV